MTTEASVAESRTGMVNVNFCLPKSPDSIGNPAIEAAREASTCVCVVVDSPAPPSLRRCAARSASILAATNGESGRDGTFDENSLSLCPS